MSFSSESTKSASDNAVMPVEQVDPMSFDRRIEKRLSAMNSNDKEVACVAVTCKGEVLLGQRRDNDKWTFPGGYLNSGEDPHAGALRELYEESGVRARELTQLGSEQYSSDPNRPNLTVYAFQLDTPHRVHPHALNDPDNEIKKWQWVNIKDVHKLDLHVKADENVMLKHLTKGSP